MKKLLILTDFSPASEKAIYFAQTLFDHTAAEFRLVHTYPIGTDLMYGTALVLDAAEEDARQQLADQLTKVTGQSVPEYHKYEVQTHVGDPILAAQFMLEQDNFDYVIVGASGSHSSELFGSTATGLIRNCQTNVLVVPAFTPIRPLTEIVLAADIRSLNSLEALKPLKEILNTKDARITLLTIVGKQVTGTAIQIDEQQKRIADYLNTDKVESYIIHDDKIDHGIVDYLDNHEVDLLITVPHQKSLLDVLKGSSVTRKLAFNPQVPLLTLYDPEPVTPQVTEKDIVVGG